MTETLDIVVGLEGTRFTVPKAVICASSNFFKNAAAGVNGLLLAEESPDTFNIYLHWLYCKTLPTILANNDPELLTEYTILVNCWLLGQTLEDRRFSEAALDAIADCADDPASNMWKKIPEATPIILVYEDTRAGSPARHVLVDIWVKYTHEDDLERLAELLPPQFLLDFAMEMTRKKRRIERDLADIEDALMDY